MPTITRTSTTDMEVTSIRFERELKEKLKELAGGQGYQNLVRDLWEYVRQHSQDFQPQYTRADLQASIVATAQRVQQLGGGGRQRGQALRRLGQQHRAAQVVRHGAGRVIDLSGRINRCRAPAAPLAADDDTLDGQVNWSISKVGGSKPTVFNVTVFPPVLGPVMTVM